MSSYVTRKSPGDTSWFVHDRFGMFIHFGLYSMPARHEWVKTNEKIEDEKRLYIHIFEYPFKFLKLYNMADKIDYAQFLHDGSEIIYYGNISAMVAPLFEGEPDDTIVMDVPVLKPNTIVPVIEIFLK